MSQRADDSDSKNSCLMSQILAFAFIQLKEHLFIPFYSQKYCQYVWKCFVSFKDFYSVKKIEWKYSC